MNPLFFTLCRWFGGWLIAGLLLAGSAAADEPMSFDLVSADLVRQPWTSVGPRGDAAQPGVSLLGSGHIGRPRFQRFDAAILSEDGGEAYALSGNGGTLTWMPEGPGGPAREIEAPQELPPLSWASSLAWDTRRGVLAILTNHVGSQLYRYDTRHHRWLDVHAVKYHGVQSLAHNAATGGYVAVSSDAQLLIFNGDGDIEEVRPLEGVLPDLAGAKARGVIGFPGLNVFAQGGRVALVNVHAGAVTRIWTYDLRSRQALLTYRPPGGGVTKATAPERPPDAVPPASAPGSVQKLLQGGVDEINSLLRDPSSWFLTLTARTEARLSLTALLSVAGLLALLAWHALRAPLAWRGRALSVISALVLSAVPALLIYSLKSEGYDLFLGPRQFWNAAELAFAAWRLKMPVEQVLGAQGLLSLMTTSACAMLAVSLCSLLLSPRPRALRWMGWFAAVLLAVAPILHFAARYRDANTYAQELAAGEAVFDARCKLAGVTRRYAVGHVEGIRLTGLRQQAPDSARTDRDWPDAGIPGDLGGPAYVQSFLDFEFNDRRTNAAWSIPGMPGMVTMRGYQFVDVLQPDGGYLRHRTGQAPEPIAPDQAARYAVSYARNDTPQDRAHWVAGATVTVTDTQTGEQVAALNVFSHVPPRRQAVADMQRRNWQEARICPAYDDVPGAMARMFAESVLQQAPR